MTSDIDFVLKQLRKHPEGRDAVQIISASFRERDCGVGAVHSRISDLRERVYVIPPAAVEGKTRRGWPRYVYRLVAEPAAPPPPEPAAPPAEPHEQLALV